MSDNMSSVGSSGKSGFIERLNGGKTIITAEGYLMELDRRGYNKNGSFIPLAVLNYPEKVEDLTREFIHAGSDVASAFVFLSNKNKLQDQGLEESFDALNRKAYDIAKKVSLDTGAYLSAGLSKTCLYDPDDVSSIEQCEQVYKDQIGISAEYGVDFVSIQTLWDYGEASIVLKISKQLDIPAVITLAPVGKEKIPTTFDGYPLKEALQRLLDEGAACVGLNCARGPNTMIPLITHLKQEIKGPLACLANGYQTSEECQTWYQLRHPTTGQPCFPDDLAPYSLGNSDALWYAKRIKELDIQFAGFCCGNTASLTRTLAMELGHQPPAARNASGYDTSKSLPRGKASFASQRYGSSFVEFTGKVLRTA